jgi:glycosyltransferase involved in cell wall biosynthesis
VLKISVITAVYNGGRTIAATVQSVARQDYQYIEHIVVDGASTDDTLAQIKIDSGRVCHIISEPDAGVYDAFNKGLRCATGDVVAFLNSGDTYTGADIVSNVVKEFLHSNTEATFGNVSIVDANNHDHVVRRYSSKRFSPRAMAYGIMPAHPTLFLHRDVYHRVGEYETQFKIAGDFELCLRVFVRGTTRYTYFPTPMVQMPRGGLSNRGWRSTWAITKEMQLACNLNGVSTNPLKLWSRVPLKLMEML